jgi:hypothetical protein
VGSSPDGVEKVQAAIAEAKKRIAQLEQVSRVMDHFNFISISRFFDHLFQSLFLA